MSTLTDDERVKLFSLLKSKVSRGAWIEKNGTTDADRSRGLRSRKIFQSIYNKLEKVV